MTTKEIIENDILTAGFLKVPSVCENCGRRKAKFYTDPIDSDSKDIEFLCRICVEEKIYPEKAETKEVRS